MPHLSWKPKREHIVNDYNSSVSTDGIDIEIYNISINGLNTRLLEYYRNINLGILLDSSKYYESLCSSTDSRAYYSVFICTWRTDMVCSFIYITVILL